MSSLPPESPPPRRPIWPTATPWTAFAPPAPAPEPPSTLKRIKEASEALVAFGSLIQVVAFVSGLLFVVLYCMTIGFFPSGLTIGDSLFFFFIVIALALLLGIAFFFAYLAVFSTAMVLHPSDAGDRVGGSLIALIMIGGALVIGGVAVMQSEARLYTGFAVLAGLAILGLSGYLSQEFVDRAIAPTDGEAVFKRAATFIVRQFVLMILFVGVSNLGLTKIVFESVGVRQERAALSLDAANLGVLASASASAELALLPCERTGGRPLVGDVTVLWHGIGERSLVELREPGTAARAVKVELKRDGVQRIDLPRDARMPERCLVVTGEQVFDANDAQVAPDGPLAKTVARVQKLVHEKGWTLAKVDVIARGDWRPAAAERVDQTRQAQARATSVTALIEKALAPDVPGVSKAIATHTSLADDSRCRTGAEEASAADCFNDNRSARVAFTLKRT